VQALLTVVEADARLVFTTRPEDGNFFVTASVDVMSGAIAHDDAQIEIKGQACPELDDADRKCREYIQSKTEKLDRDWHHWVDPGDPLVAVIRERRGIEQEQVLALVSAARQLAAQRSPDAKDLAGRVAEVLGVEPRQVLRR
jgi:hypothetical protein